MTTHHSEGEVAYEAYCREAEGRSLVTGSVLPSWVELPAVIQAAWVAAASAAVEQHKARTVHHD